MLEKDYETKEVKQPKKQKESKYPRQELIQRAEDIFGCKPEIVVGALHGNDDKELAISEVKKLINKFLRKRV